MAWSNFSHLTTFDTERITGRGSGRTAESTPPAGHRLKPLDVESASGGPAQKPPEHVARFMEARAKSVRHLKVDPNVRTRPWFVEATKDTSQKLESVVAATGKYLAKGANEQNLSDAQAVLNEISRTAEGSALVRKLVTKDNIARIANLSRGRR
jgi:hypothetical protein